MILSAPTRHFWKSWRNGAAGSVQHAEGTTGEPDTYTLTDLNGTQFVYFGFDGDASPAEGQLWKIIDPSGNTAYVGDSSTGSTAISGGYDSGGRIETAYDSAGRRYSVLLTQTLATPPCSPPHGLTVSHAGNSRRRPSCSDAGDAPVVRAQRKPPSRSQKASSRSADRPEASPR